MSDRCLQKDSARLATWMRAVGFIDWGGYFRLLGLVIGLGLLGLSPAPASALLLAYIPNDTTPGTVSVIDTATNTVVGTILVGNDPYGIAVHPDLTRVYVTNSGSHRVSVINTSINREVATIPVGRIPHGIAVHPAGIRVYVANGDNGAGNTVSVIDTATNTEITRVQVGSFPNGVAVHPDGKVVYVTNIRSDSVSVIDTATNTVIATIPVEREPHDVTFHPAGTFAYVTNRQQSFSGCLRGSVSVIDTTARDVIDTVCVGTFPHSPVVHPDGIRVYVTNRDDDTVSVINTATNTVIATIPVGDAPHGVNVHPDGTFAYVANAGSNSISVINLVTNTVVNTVPVGGNPIAQGRFISPGSIVPGISGLVSNKGGDIGTATVFIYGQGFAKDATVKLIRPGQPDILGTSVKVLGFGDTITTTFDLTGQARGPWTVVVANPDGTSITLPDGFTIEEGRAAQVWVDIVGRNTTISGRPQLYFIVYGNRGNVDAVGVPLTISISKGTLVNLNFPVTSPPLLPGQDPIDWSQIPPLIDPPDRTLLPLILPLIPAGQSDARQITVTPEATGHYTVVVSVSTALSSELTPFLAHSFSDADLRAIGKDFIACSFALSGLVVAGLITELELPAIGAIAGLIAGTLLVDVITDAVTQPQPGQGVASGSQLLGDSALLALKRLGKPEPPIAMIFNIISLSYTIGPCFKQVVLDLTSLPPPPSGRSSDPNDKVGSQGAGAAQYLSAQEPLRYVIFFENEATATAPAHEIIITDPLDLTHMDLTTVRLGPISFGDSVITPPAQIPFTTDVDLRPAQNLIVRINANLDADTGLLTWRFTSLDPTTGLPPTDPLVGFLPPNTNPPAGQGGGLFTVMPKAGLPTGTQIQNQATVVFDTNAPIATPIWVNTLDSTKPTSQVSPLAATQTSPNFQVQWSGTDVGSGINDYTIFVSDNSGPFTPFVTNSAATSATYPGVVGHTYRFFSQARDLTSNVEALKTQAEATTQVVASDTIPPTTAAIASPNANPNGWNNADVTVTLTATDNSGGSGVKNLSFTLGGASTGRNVVAGSSAVVAITVEGSTTLTYFATDNAGNQEAPKMLTVQIDKTKPVITGSRSPTPNANGWNNTNVTVSFSCADAGSVPSGIATNTVAGQTLSSEGAGQSVTSTGSCLDKAGNAADPATVSGINIDRTNPTSHVLPLPSSTTTTSFTVQWSGTDGGSGIKDFTISVSDNGGPFTAWLTNTAVMSAPYPGVAGHTYGFFSQAQDLAGNVEALKTQAEATTQVVTGGNTLTSLSSATLWIGLKNSDDQGTQFDLRVEVYKGSTLVASGQMPCITGVTRNPDQAKQVMVSFDPFVPVGMASGNALSLKVLTRIGTNPNGTKCAGPGGSHNNAVGLRLYYDAVSRPAQFGAQINSNSPTATYLHSGSNDFLNNIAPNATSAKFKDSSAVNFNNGNLWQAIGTWSMTLP